MKTLFAAALAASTVILPAAAQAQALPTAQIAVVDTARVGAECNACVTAAAQLNQQRDAIRAREAELAGPLEASGQAIQNEINALNGAQPSADLQQRAQQFEASRQAAAREIAQRQQTLQRNSAYVSQQFTAQLQPAVQAVMQARGATLVMDEQQALMHSPAIDITADVLAEVNRRLTSIVTTAPAPAQPAQQQTPPAGR